MNFLKELWRGDVPLFKTYWVFGFAVSVLLNALMILVVSVMEKNPAIESVFLGLWGATTLYGVFIAVAIWRSAGKYQGPKHWMFLARAMVVLSILRTIANVAGIG